MVIILAFLFVKLSSFDIIKLVVAVVGHFTAVLAGGVNPYKIGGKRPPYKSKDRGKQTPLSNKMGKNPCKVKLLYYRLFQI
jgi:hypothetical protein